MKSKDSKKQVVKPLVSVHVVHYACSNCDEESEEVKMCKECNAPSRVIKVSELYGQEATDYLDNLKEEKENLKKKKAPSVSGVQFDDSVSGAETDDYEEETFSKEEKAEEEDVALSEIFPEEEEEYGEKKKFVDDLGDDFEAALDVLDQEDEGLDSDVEDLPEL